MSDTESTETTTETTETTTETPGGATVEESTTKETTEDQE